ncbi:T9SS type A sorting domain-containing protein [uncultured Flavobacterium sp.]|uniref:DUF7619 domain-containing protein n=1 Tax=uncultured Flavobacterium sp. TaxID=165435 RepID=UPI0030EC13C4
METLICSNTTLTSLNVSQNTALTELRCESINLTSLNLTQNTALTHLYCSTNNLTSLNVTQNTALTYLNCYQSNLTSLDVSQNTALTQLNCADNNLTSLDVTQNTALIVLICYYNNLTSLDVSQNTALTHLDCGSTNLTSLNVSQNTALTFLNCSNNNLTSIDVTQNTALTDLRCESINLTSLDVTQNTALIWLYCNYNNLTSLDVSQNMNLKLLYCKNNQLETLFIKNNNLIWSESTGSNGSSLIFSNNPNLDYVCADEEDVAMVQQKVNTYGYSTTCTVNSYCSFTPGGTFYTIEGINKWDFDNNGCDVLDYPFPNLKYNIANGNVNGIIISNTSGNYSIPVQAGTHTITPVLENPTYFNISPISFVANFPTQTSPLVQNFCVTANGIHHDVEIVLMPTNPARPGFDANYTIVYKNKGNQIENGSVTLDFNDLVSDLVSANPTFSSQATNAMTWNYTNLQPFETRTIDLVFNVNGPTETPAVNIGDVLNYTASITPLTTDEFVSDNTSTLNQTVVGSYDPNDKTCIEGTTVGPDMIGQYVHYVIRFENTGTYPAENVVVKDMIDLAKFDVSTLIPLHSSHDFVTRINGNKVEFIFEGINLPFDDSTNDGYVAFKIKTKSNLLVGSTFSNNANIYFDYNFPITTNTFTSTIQVLKVKDFDFGTHFTLYPNPVKDVLNIQSKDNTTINSIEIYNTLGQVVLAVPNAISTVDVSNLQSGNYFVKVNTDLGVSNTKFIKE